MTAPTREQVEEWHKEARSFADKAFHADPMAAVWFTEYQTHFAALAFTAGQSAPAGSGAELVREVEEAAANAVGFLETGKNPFGSIKQCQDALEHAAFVTRPLWPRLRAALISGDAAREDSARLEFYESHPNAISYATGRRGSVSHWYSRKDGYLTVAPTLRKAIDRARGWK